MSLLLAGKRSYSTFTIGKRELVIDGSNPDGETLSFIIAAQPGRKLASTFIIERGATISGH